jgi:hypothetical protein
MGLGAEVSPWGDGRGAGLCSVLPCLAHGSQEVSGEFPERPWEKAGWPVCLEALQWTDHMDSRVTPTGQSKERVPQGGWKLLSHSFCVPGESSHPPRGRGNRYKQVQRLGAGKAGDTELPETPEVCEEVVHRL